MKDSDLCVQALCSRVENVRRDVRLLTDQALGEFAKYVSTAVTVTVWDHRHVNRAYGTADLRVSAVITDGCPLDDGGFTKGDRRDLCEAATSEESWDELIDGYEAHVVPWLQAKAAKARRLVVPQTERKSNGSQNNCRRTQ